MDREAGKRKIVSRGLVEALEPRRLLDSSVRIDAGGPAFKDSSGLMWAADAGFTGGTAIHTSLAIAGTTADSLYFNYRSGNFSYALAMPNGSYSLRLLFTEPTATAKGQRTFDVLAEGQTLLSKLDLFATGGTRTAISKTFTVNVADGVLNLGFQGVVGSAVVSAIQTTLISAEPVMVQAVRAVSDVGFSPYTVARSATTLGTSLFLNVGGPAITDSLGNHWAADSGTGWSGGNATTGKAAVGNTVDDMLFDSRRSGPTMTYALPAANGFYELDLYFVDPTMTTANQRVFNVSAQGTTILSNFDIVKAVGANTADIQAFDITISTGQLNLVFSASTYNAIVSAIHLKPLGPPAAPSVPSGLSAASVSPTAERLTWIEDANSSVNSFVIDRFDAVAGVFSPVATVPGSARGYTDQSLMADSVYQYEIQATGPGGESAFSDPVGATTLSALPSPWVDGDVGAAGLIGGAGTVGNTFSVSGSGADMYAAADGFHFVYQPVTGDVTIIARVTGQQNTDPWARAGLVIRQSLSASAAMADIFLSPGNGVVFQNRLTSGASAAGLVSFAASVGVWLKLVRNVNTVAGYFSNDGTHWTLAGTQTFAPAGTVYVGMCVCAHNNSMLNTSTFDQVSVAVSTPFQWIVGANALLTAFESPNAVVGNDFYVFGGFDDVALDATTVSNVYHLNSNSWSPITPMPIPVTHAGVAVAGSDIFFAGGFVGKWPSSITNQFMMYDTAANSWTVLTPLPAARGAGGLVLLGNQLHFFGGINSTKTTDMGDHWVYDLDNPAAGWTTAALMPGPRNHFGYTVLDGKAYVIGGEHLLDEDHANQSEVDVYDPQSKAWTTVAPLPAGRSHTHTSTFVYDDKIMIITGQENGPSEAQTVADAMMYDPMANQWTMIACPAPAVRQAAAAKVIGNVLVVTGGADQNHLPQSTTWIGDLRRLFDSPPIQPIPLIQSAHVPRASSTREAELLLPEIADFDELRALSRVSFDELPTSE